MREEKKYYVMIAAYKTNNYLGLSNVKSFKAVPGGINLYTLDNPKKDLVLKTKAQANSQAKKLKEAVEKSNLYWEGCIIEVKEYNENCYLFHKRMQEQQLEGKEFEPWEVRKELYDRFHYVYEMRKAEQARVQKGKQELILAI